MCSLFKRFANQMPGTTTGHLNSGPVFKWWSEYWSVNQMVIWIPNYHGTGHLNSKPFDERTNTHDLNTVLRTLLFRSPLYGSFLPWVRTKSATCLNDHRYSVIIPVNLPRSSLSTPQLLKDLSIFSSPPHLPFSTKPLSIRHKFD